MYGYSLFGLLSKSTDLHITNGQSQPATAGTLVEQEIEDTSTASLQFHRQKHEEYSAEMALLAQRLKSTTQAFGDVLKQDDRVGSFIWIKEKNRQREKERKLERERESEGNEFIMVVLSIKDRQRVRSLFLLSVHVCANTSFRLCQNDGVFQKWLFYHFLSFQSFYLNSFISILLSQSRNLSLVTHSPLFSLVQTLSETQTHMLTAEHRLKKELGRLKILTARYGTTCWMQLLLTLVVLLVFIWVYILMKLFPKKYRPVVSIQEKEEVSVVVTTLVKTVVPPLSASLASTTASLTRSVGSHFMGSLSSSTTTTLSTTTPSSPSLLDATTSLLDNSGMRTEPTSRIMVRDEL